jgi:hypothetical protein
MARYLFHRSDPCVSVQDPGRKARQAIGVPIPPQIKEPPGVLLFQRRRHPSGDFPQQGMILLLEIMYELPSLQDVVGCCFDEDVILHGARPQLVFKDMRNRA